MNLPQQYILCFILLETTSLLRVWPTSLLEKPVGVLQIKKPCFHISKDQSENPIVSFLILFLKL